MKRRPPYVSTVLATALVLTLLGAYGLALLQGRELVRELRENTKVVVEVRPGTSEAARAILQAFLVGRAYVKPGSLVYLSREEGARRLREEFGESFLDFELDNPLYEVYTFNVPERYVDAGAIARLREEVTAQPAVLASYVQEDLVRTLTQRVGALAWVGLGLGGVLLLGVVFLVVNTTRLALLAKATLVRNMALVGASWSFIARPFLRRAALLGALAGGLAAAMTAGLAAFAKTYLPGAWQEVPPYLYVSLAIALPVLGLLLNYLATLMVVRRTLRLRDDDLALL